MKVDKYIYISVKLLRHIYVIKESLLSNLLFTQINNVISKYEGKKMKFTILRWKFMVYSVADRNLLNCGAQTK